MSFLNPSQIDFTKTKARKDLRKCACLRFNFQTLHCTSIWFEKFVKWSFENVLLLLLLVEDESRKRMTMLSLEVFVTRTQLSSASNFLSYPKIIIRVNNPLFVKWNWTIFIYFHVDVEKVVTKEKDLLSINLSNNHHFKELTVWFLDVTCVTNPKMKSTQNSIGWNLKQDPWSLGLRVEVS